MASQSSNNALLNSKFSQRCIYGMKNKLLLISGLSAIAVLIADYSGNPAESFFNDAPAAESCSYIGLRDWREDERRRAVHVVRYGSD